MGISRKRFAVSALSAPWTIAFLRHRVDAAEFSCKLGIGTPATHPMTVRSQEVAERIKQQSGGRLDIQVFPNNSLGGEAAMLAQVRIGAIEFFLPGYGDLMDVIPIMGISSIPFAFVGYKDVWSAMDGSLGRYLRDAIVSAKLGIVPIGKAWESGFRQVGNNVHPLRTPEDLKGLKIRVSSFPIVVDMFTAFGAQPTPTSANGIYTALQTHLVDGADVTFAAVETGKYYEVQKYLSVTNHIWAGKAMVVNDSLWQRFDRGLRDIVERNFNAGVDLNRTDIMRLDANIKATLESHGVIFNEAEGVTFRAALRASGRYSKWRDQVGGEGWSHLERAVGKLA